MYRHPSKLKRARETKLKKPKRWRLDLKNVLNTTKRKAGAVILASTIAVGSLGTGAYAYKDEWTGKIQQGVHLLANQVFPSIQPAIETYGKSKESALATWVAGVITDTQKKINDFKNAEIARGKAEIDSHDNDNRIRLQDAANNAIQAEKDAQKAKDDAAIKKEQNDLDKVVEDALNQIPK